MAVSLEQFGRFVSESRVLSSEQLKAFWASIPAAERPKSGDELANQLVFAGKLTSFQAQELVAGRGRRLVLGDYTLVDRIGAGGMGQVFRAHHRRLDKIVALKVLAERAMQDDDAVKRFLREVRAAGKVVHPNIVVAHDAGESQGVHYLVMEYVAGHDLGALVKKEGPLSIDAALSCITQAALGLEHAHQCGLIHRDIKPNNLVLDTVGTLKILDLGLARIEDPLGDRTADHLTETGRVMGTIDFMSPEQALDSRYVDGRTDIYSLGCTLYYLLNGRPPYGGETVMQRLLAHREARIPPLARTRTDVPAELDGTFRRMIAKRAEDRPATMRDVLEALQIAATVGAVGATASPQFGAGETPVETSATTTLLPLSAATPDETASYLNSGLETGGLDFVAPVKHIGLGVAAGDRRRRLTVAAGIGVGLIAIGLGVWALLGQGGSDGLAKQEAKDDPQATVTPSPRSSTAATAGRSSVIPWKPGDPPLRREAIFEAFDAPLKAVWADTSCSQLAKILRSDYGMNVYLDVFAMTADGITPATILSTAPSAGSSLKTALKTTLDQRGLGMTVVEDVLWITTNTRLQSEIAPVETRAFIIEPPVEVDKAREFIRMIEDVDPDSWRAAGGRVGEVQAGREVLLVRHRAEMIRELARRYRTMLRHVERDTTLSGFAEPIRSGLAKRMSLKALDHQLADVLKTIEAESGIPCQLDLKALSADGKDGTLAIKLELEDVTVEQMLDTLTDSYGLDWKLEGEVIIITIPRDADRSLMPLEYDATDLNRFFPGFVTNTGPNQANRLQKKLATDVMDQITGPQYWRTYQGTGTTKELPDGKTLVVDQCFRVHRRLQRIYAELHSAAKMIDDKAR